MRSVAIELTARCNQKCTYCYNSWRDDGGRAMGELDHDTLIGLIDNVLDDRKLGHITLTGGEPFLRKDIGDVIDHINARGLGVVIISNGGAIKDHVVERLATQKVHYIQVTLAGADAATHDTVAGKGSFDRAVGILRKLSAAGVTIGGSYLVTRESYHQADAVMETFAGLGVDHVAFNRFNPSGFSTDAMHALMPTRSMIVQALTAANRVAGEHELRVVCTMPIPPCVIDESDYPHIRFGYCSAGVEEGEYAVGPDGALRLCTLQKDRLGNLLEESVTDILARDGATEFRKQTPEFCRGCKHEHTCLGGCGASAQWIFGGIDELDPFVAQHVYPDYKQRTGVEPDDTGRIPVSSLRLNRAPEAQTSAQ